MRIAVSKKPSPRTSPRNDEIILIPKRLRADWMDVMALDVALSHVAFRASCVAGSHFNRHTGEAFMTLETMARVMAVCERTAWTASKESERRGYLIIKRREFGLATRKSSDGRDIPFRAAGGKGVANVYLPALDGEHARSGKLDRKLAARCELLWSQSSQKNSSKVAAVCKPTLTSPSEKNLTPPKADKAGFDTSEPLAAIIVAAIGDVLFQSWFGSLSIYSEEDGVLTLVLPNKWLCSEVEKRFGPNLLRWCQCIYPDKKFVRLRPP
jgi:hypothetical protein